MCKIYNKCNQKRDQFDFTWKYGYPELLVKIGIDEGENTVIQYRYEKNSLIDILRYSMNITSKIMFLTAPNSIIIGENLYNLLEYGLQSEFKEILLPTDKWKYINPDTKKPYRIYLQKNVYKIY